MDDLWLMFVIIFLFVLIPAVLWIILNNTIRRRELSNGVVNHDPMKQIYVYRINMTEGEFWTRLRRHNDNDPLEYCLDERNMDITFSMLGSVTYKMSIEKREEYLVLQIRDASFFSGKSQVHLLVNEFWITKFGAIPLDYWDFVNQQS